MARFFRNIRQQLLVENRFTRYLIYAIGEIFLVVVGIMIAVYFNNKNTDKKTKAETNRLVADLEKGLKTNQFLLDRFSGRFDAQDSMMGLLINGELTEENFKRNRILNDLMGNSTQYAWLQDENIITILQKERDFDLSYNQLIKLIKSYKSRLDDLEKTAEELNELGNWNEKLMADNFDWYSGTTKEDRDKKVQYILRDPFYKNRLSLFRKKFKNQISNITSMAAIRAAIMGEIKRLNEGLNNAQLDEFFKTLGMQPFPQLDCSELEREWEDDFSGLIFFLFFNGTDESVTIYRLRENVDAWESFKINPGEYEIFGQVPGRGFMIGSPDSCQQLFVAKKRGYLLIK
ncbi:hypothetical protein [Aquiflexum gelatinilyticum]|uniref:Uncharacterized protein n=1 Tax=Aquiflexum gelatinilyticum TaxID=2961943 RepID=A0A9X2P8Y8_9BACT|nr:hypothetical protein [Aquiflexum gelatinilyticum]MCR9015990.1 hypothetical protein [Aquiflexum gelatinilyticum]